MDINAYIDRLKQKFSGQTEKKQRIEEVVREIAGIPEQTYLVCTYNEGTLKIEASPAVRQKIFSYEEDLKNVLQQRCNTKVSRLV